jgi:hypothetical protein
LRIPDREPITNRHEGSDHPAPAILDFLERYDGP